jgi:hypothetical protein
MASKQWGTRKTAPDYRARLKTFGILESCDFWLDAIELPDQL